MKIRILVCFAICLVTSFVTDAASGNGKSTRQEGFDDLVSFDPNHYFTNYVPPPSPLNQKRQTPTINEFLTLYLALRYVWNNVLNPTTTTTTTVATTSLKEAATTAAVTTVAATTVAAAPTTATIPVTQWTASESCRYQLFNYKLTWNDADANCKVYGATLAQVNMRDNAKRAAVLSAVNYPTGTFVWVGVSDTDSANSAVPTWLDTTVLTPTPPSGSYTSLAGTVGCGYYSSTFVDPNFYRFTACSDATLLDIPSYYLCELC